MVAEKKNNQYYREGAVKRATTQERARMQGWAPNPDAGTTPRASKTPAQSAPAITLTPNARNLAENAFGRLPGERTKGGAGVIKMMANSLLDMAEKLDKVVKATLAPTTPTDAPDPPRMTQ